MTKKQATDFAKDFGYEDAEVEIFLHGSQYTAHHFKEELTSVLFLLERNKAHQSLINKLKDLI